MSLILPPLSIVLQEDIPGIGELLDCLVQWAFFMNGRKEGKENPEHQWEAGKQMKELLGGETLANRETESEGVSEGLGTSVGKIAWSRPQNLCPRLAMASYSVLLKFSAPKSCQYFQQISPESWKKRCKYPNYYFSAWHMISINVCWINESNIFSVYLLSLAV